MCSFYCTVQSVLRYVNNSLKFKNNQYEIYIQSALNASNLFRWCQWLETIDIFIKTDSQNTITDYRQNHQKWPTSNKQPTYLFNQVLYLLGTKISFMMLPIIGKFPKMELMRQERSQKDASDNSLTLENIRTVLGKLLNHTGLGKHVLIIWISDQYWC